MHFIIYTDLSVARIHLEGTFAGAFTIRLFHAMTVETEAINLQMECKYVKFRSHKIANVICRRTMEHGQNAVTESQV